MILVQVLLVGTGLLFVAMAIPLMRRKVRPNGWYGLRVAATFADEWVWYEANARAGRDMLVVGVIQILVAIGMPRLGASEMAYVSVNIALLLVGTIAMAIVGTRRANALLKTRQTCGPC